MNHHNPFASPTAGTGTIDTIDPKLLRLVATHLAAARRNPPTVVRTLSKWPGVPFLFLIGIVGTALLAMMANSPESPITSHWPVGLAAMVLGAMLRDLGTAVRVARLWKPQSHFIDWQKVDEFIT